MKALEPLLAQVRPEVACAGAVGLLAVLTIGSCVSVVRPSFDEYRRLDRTHEEVVRQSELANVDQVELKIRALEARIQDLREGLYGNASEIPAREVESHVIQSLDRISGRHAVELVSVTPGAAGHEASFEELPYDVRVSGAYFHLFEWLGDMEDELRPMVVKQFELSPQSATDQVDLTLQLVAYRASPEAP